MKVATIRWDFPQGHADARSAQGWDKIPVLAGKVWFDRELLQEAMGGTGSGQESKAERFTERERQVLSCVFEGMVNKEIAERIDVSESSVKATLQQLFSKTGVRTRGELVRVALEQYRDQI